MKKLFLSFFLLITALIDLNAQKTIINPAFSYQISLSKITKIELTDTATILYFKTIVKPGSSIFIDSSNYISPVNSNKKFFVKGFKGIPVGWNKTWNILDSGVVHFQLTQVAAKKTIFHHFSSFC